MLELYCQQHGWESVYTLKDIGSGLNYKKRGLLKLIDLLQRNEVERLLITDKDRLLRFGSELIFALCENNATEIIILNKPVNQEPEQELVEDVLAVITVMSARLYGKRSRRNLKAMQAIYRRTKDEPSRSKLLDLIHNDPTSDPWLHRVFRTQYQRGHTFVRNQIVYQGGGYTCKGLTRNTVKLEVQGLEKGKRITLKLKCRHTVSGQIRLICNEDGQLEVHCTRKRMLSPSTLQVEQEIGIDKGYTEAFYTSDGDSIAGGLGHLMTEKTKRITRTNRNRYRLRFHAKNNPEKSAMILKNNLGYKVKSRKLKREKATIQNFIRKDLRRVITSPIRIFAEDLTSPIKGKQQAKPINRFLDQWMKGELQASTLEDRIGDWINCVCGESSLYVANVFSYRDVIGSTGWGSFYLLYRGRNSSRQKRCIEHSASRL